MKLQLILGLLGCFLTSHMIKAQNINTLEFANLIMQFLPLYVPNIQNFGNISDIINFSLPFNITFPNNTCGNQLYLLMNSLIRGELWAIKMIDAWAKPQSGIMYGNIMHVGNYDECLEIKARSEEEDVAGKYCTAVLSPHKKYGEFLESWLSQYMNVEIVEEQFVATYLKRSFGLCLPSVCSVEDLQGVIENVEESIKFPIHFQFDERFCDAGESRPLSSAAIFAIVVFGGFGLIIVFSTLYDVLVFQKRNGEGSKISIYVAFSLYTNMEKLLSTKTVEGSLDCLNGIRVLSMVWILLIHRLLHLFFAPLTNTFLVEEWKHQVGNSFYVAGVMAVDSFFVVSGLLVTYVFLKSRAKGQEFSFPMFCLHRILRLTPSLAMVVLFYATLLTYIGRGPFWPIVYDMFQKSCEKYWWATLTYLQNYVNTHEECVGQCWYLAADTQLYFISPLFLFPLAKWPRRTITAMFVVVVIVCAYVLEITWRKRLGVTFFDQSPEQFEYYYSPTHVRLSTYLIGAVCGYVIFITRSKPIHLCKFLVIILWAISLLTVLGIVLAYSVFTTNEYEALEGGIFNALTKPAWALALSIIILLCVNGYGGIINSFLSNPVFNVLIRINYNIYLLHIIVMAFLVGQHRTPVFFSNITGIHLFCGDFVFTALIATAWTLAFELPVLTIEKVIFAKPISITNRIENGKIVVSTDPQISKNSCSPPPSYTTEVEASTSQLPK